MSVSKFNHQRVDNPLGVLYTTRYVHISVMLPLKNSFTSIFCRICVRTTRLFVERHALSYICQIWLFVLLGIYASLLLFTSQLFWWGILMCRHSSLPPDIVVLRVGTNTRLEAVKHAHLTWRHVYTKGDKDAEQKPTLKCETPVHAEKLQHAGCQSYLCRKPPLTYDTKLSVICSNVRREKYN